MKDTGVSSNLQPRAAAPTRTFSARESLREDEGKPTDADVLQGLKRAQATKWITLAVFDNVLRHVERSNRFSARRGLNLPTESFQRPRARHEPKTVSGAFGAAQSALYGRRAPDAFTVV